MNLFLAGPFFSDEEVDRLDRVKKALEREGFEVYSTYHRNSRIDLGKPGEKRRRFRLLCKRIRESDGVFAVLDGRDPGTIWEIGYAFASGKPVVAFCERDPFFSLMVDQSCTCLSGLRSIDGKIRDYLKATDINATPKYSFGMKEDY